MYLSVNLYANNKEKYLGTAVQSEGVMQKLEDKSHYEATNYK
jgi:hypothetical protein